jgi:hypothetical protein
VVVQIMRWPALFVVVAVGLAFVQKGRHQEGSLLIPADHFHGLFSEPLNHCVARFSDIKAGKLQSRYLPGFVSVKAIFRRESR